MARPVGAGGLPLLDLRTSIRIATTSVKNALSPFLAAFCS
jgi:hypothetical protein